MTQHDDEQHLRDALHRHLSTEPTSDLVTGALGRAGAIVRRRRIVAAACAAIIVVAVAGVVTTSGGSDGPAAPPTLGVPSTTRQAPTGPPSTSASSGRATATAPSAPTTPSSQLSTARTTSAAGSLPAPETSRPPAPSSTPPATSPSARSTAPSSTAAAIVACAPATTRLSFTVVDAAAGSVHYLLSVTNSGTAPCVLTGYPGVSMVDQFGHQIGAPAARDPDSSPVVTLRPGEVASAPVSVSQAANYGGSCTTTSATGLRVYLPDRRDSAIVSATLTGCTEATIVLMHLRPFQAG